ncbi:g633 [Coccomyxa elongata]
MGWSFPLSLDVNWDGLKDAVNHAGHHGHQLLTAAAGHAQQVLTAAAEHFRQAFEQTKDFAEIWLSAWRLNYQQVVFYTAMLTLYFMLVTAPVLHIGNILVTIIKREATLPEVSSALIALTIICVIFNIFQPESARMPRLLAHFFARSTPALLSGVANGDFVAFQPGQVNLWPKDNGQFTNTQVQVQSSLVQQ